MTFLLLIDILLLKYGKKYQYFTYFEIIETMPELAQSLDKIVEETVRLKEVRKEDLQFGDMVIVRTRNSVYSLLVIDSDDYLVSGGWFDRKGLSPMKATISGCTWGGSIIKIDTLAACGLRLELGNRVLTTTIQKLYIIRGNGKN